MHNAIQFNENGLYWHYDSGRNPYEYLNDHKFSRIVQNKGQWFLS